MHLLAYTSSLRDKGIDAVSVRRIDPSRKGWWQSIWRDLIVLKTGEALSSVTQFTVRISICILCPSPYNTSWEERRVILASSQQVRRPSQVQHRRPLKGLCFQLKGSFYLSPLPFIPIDHPIQIRLITHILPTDDPPPTPHSHIIVTNAGHPPSASLLYPPSAIAPLMGSNISYPPAFRISTQALPITSLYFLLIDSHLTIWSFSCLYSFMSLPCLYHGNITSMRLGMFSILLITISSGLSSA